MKATILKRLKETDGILSGQQLSDELTISRVSVWKHIQTLQKMGYPIDSTPKGYRLASVPDLLHPWEFPARESRTHYFEEVGSTMDVARDMARGGAPHFSVVLAERQKKGRGRLKRTWWSGKGGLYATVILRPEIPPVSSPLLSFSAAVAMVRTLREVFHVTAHVKWPNDIRVSGRKIAGILSEMEAEGDLVTYVNIGIGINANNDPTRKEPTATSLKRELNRRVSRQQVLNEFLNRLEDTAFPDTLSGIVTEWKQYTDTLHRPVRVETYRHVYEGTAIDVDESGALIIRDSDAKRHKILCGDCYQD